MFQYLAYKTGHSLMDRIEHIKQPCAFPSLSCRGIVGGNESRVPILADVITGKLPDPGHSVRTRCGTYARISK